MYFYTGNIADLKRLRTAAIPGACPRDTPDIPGFPTKKRAHPDDNLCVQDRDNPRQAVKLRERRYANQLVVRHFFGAACGPELAGNGNTCGLKGYVMTEPAGHGKKLRREAGVIGLLYASLGGIIGSGWLFGPMYAAQAAGPLSIFSWVIGGVAILLLAMVYAELATMFPRSGAVVHFPHLSHGSLLARIWSWILFLGYVTIAPVEVLAVLRYADDLLAYLGKTFHSFPQHVPHLVQMVDHQRVLTDLGIVVAIALLALFTAINLWGIKWALRISNTAGWWKLGIPILATISLLCTVQHGANLHIPAKSFSTDFHGMFTAIATSGVVFSYLGFRQAVELAGESANPQRNIPIAVIGSVLIGMVLYVVLQLAFVLAVDPAAVHQYGWGALGTIKAFKVGAGPFASLATGVGLGWLAWLLYADAIVSPAGTGFIYTTTSARVIHAMSEDGFIHPTMKKLNRNSVPWAAGVLSFCVGILFLLPFPTWKKMVDYISSVMLLSYGIGPIVLLSLRHRMGNISRPFKLPWANVLAPLTFVISNIIIYWAGLATDTWLMGLLTAFFIVFMLYRLIFDPAKIPLMNWKNTWWVLPYLGGLWLITFLGSKSMVDGRGIIAFPYDLVVLTIFSLLILVLAVKSAIPLEEMEAYIQTQEI